MHKRIHYYITSHGFGHSTRAIEVINRLPVWLDVEIITSTPRWLFDHSIQRPFTYRERLHDPGIVQQNCLQNDLESTYECWQRLLDEYPRLVQEECQRIRREGAGLVVGDISPFAVAVAREMGSDSVIVANFSWDWIFRAFLKRKPAFQDLIDRISSYYHNTTLLLQTPLCGDLSVFPRKREIPLIVRRSRMSRTEARQHFQLKTDEKVVLISFGGMGLDAIRPEYLERYRGITFLTFDRQLLGPSNVRFLPPGVTYHPDAIQAADLALTKLGYGIVTECIAHRTPIVYPPRHDFPEHQILERDASRWIEIYPVAENTFYSGKWGDLENLCKTEVNHEESEEYNSMLQGGDAVAEFLSARFPG